MAKRINFRRVQADSRVGAGGAGEFRTFPGSGGSFSAETPDIGDTILGQTFESVQRGLIDWKVSTDGIYKGYPGYTCRIARGGTPTRDAAMPTTELGMSSQNIKGIPTDVHGYQITDPDKRTLDRTKSVSISAGDILLVDYLDGIVYVDADQSDPTISAYYRPLTAVARATDYTLTMGVTMRDETNFVESTVNHKGGDGAYHDFGSGVSGFRITNEDRYSADPGSTGTDARYPAYHATLVMVDAVTSAISVAYDETAQNLTVTLASSAGSGTSGASTSTAANVVDAINGSAVARAAGFTASLLGDGTGAVSTATMEPLDEGGWIESPPDNIKNPDARGGYMLYSPGLRTVSLSLSGVTVPERKFSATLNLREALRAREEYLLEINPDGLQAKPGRGVGFRGWFRLANTSEEGDVGQTQTTSIDFTLSVPVAGGAVDETPVEIAEVFALVGNVQRLPGAVLDAADSWLNEEFQNEVQYLPSGKVGDGTGITGKVVVSDLSLSGGLSSMNSFNIELMGNGRYIDI